MVHQAAKWLPAGGGLCLATGLWLCWSEFGHEFWGNWLHSGSFTLGAVLVVVGGSLIAGPFVGRKPTIVCAVGLLVAYLALLWTWPGWLVVHHVIGRSIDWWSGRP